MPCVRVLVCPLGMRLASIRNARFALVRIVLGLTLLVAPWPATPAHAVSFGFVVGIGANSTDTGGAVAVDGAGNVYVTGNFTGTVDFDRTATRNDDVLTSTFEPNSTTFRSRDVFVAKYGPSGSLIWARSVGGPGDDDGEGIALDNAGNVYVVGEFSETADFQPGSGTFNLTNAGAQDIFVLKLDTNGSFGWATGVGGTFTDLPAGIVVSSDGANTFVTGSFRGTADFDRTAATTGDTLASQGGADGFVLNLNAGGGFGWVRQIGGPGDQEPHGLAFGVSGIYVTGEFAGTAFGGSQTLTSNGGDDAFVAHYRPSGTLIWAKSVGGPSTDRGNAITADGFGNVYVTGIFRGLVDFDPGPNTFNVTSENTAVFLLKLDALTNGTFVSVGTITSTGFPEAFAVTMDRGNTGNVYLAGRFSGTADFDPGPGVMNLASGGSLDGFLVKLNPDMSPVYARTFGGTGTNVYPFGVTTDGAGGVYLAGSMTNGPADFDPGPGTANLTSAGDLDAWTLRLVEDAPVNTIPAGTQTVVKGSTKVFSAATFNQISVSAPDAGSGLRVLLAAINVGTISLATTAGLTFQSGDGTNDAGMTFTGTQAAVNAALDGLRYTPPSNFTGPAGIQIRSGLASGETGSVRNDLDNMSITVVDGTCAPRPQVRVQQAIGGGQLQVTITSTALPSNPNPLAGVRFGTLGNARVTLNGQAMSNGQGVPLPAGATQTSFTVRRATAGPATTVPLTVVDACGPWQTLVGAGTGVSGIGP